MTKEPFISTDVDKVLKLLKEKGRMEIGELAKNAGLGIHDVEKWCRMLEEQGLVKIEYHLTRTYAVWRGETKLPTLSQAVAPRERPQLEEKLERLLASAREIQQEIKRPAVKPEETKPETKPPAPTPAPVRGAKPKEIVELSEALKAKISEINQKAREIEELKNEREALLHNAYLPIAKRLEAELEALEDRLQAKETQILRLRQRAIEIPDKISNVELDVLKLKQKEEEARKALEETTTKIQQTVSLLRELQAGVVRSSEEARRAIARETETLNDMENALAKLSDIERETMMHIKEARERIEQETARIKSMEEMLGKLKQSESETKKRIEEARARLQSESARVTELESAITELRKIDEWINAYQKEYEKKFAEFTAYVKENESEFNALREAIETGFVRKYLKELKELSESHEYEVKQVLKKEEALNAKAEAAKKSLAQLIQESKEISTRFEELLKQMESGRSASERLRRLEEKREKVEEKLSESGKTTASIEDDLAVLFREKKK
ncbi:MAG: hypothetical protein QXG98_00315 [Candidatus Micrarchaeia archaeon]